MIKKVNVIDYGAGNLKSIVKSLAVLGLTPKIVNPLLSTTNHQLLDCDLLVLPGVGEFGSSLKVLNIVKDKIVQHIVSGKPLLGICLGIQLLFDKSEESPGTKGLGLIAGEVVKFKYYKKFSLPVPHMCWNKVRFIEVETDKVKSGKIDKRAILLQNLDEEEFFYFVHSYYPVPEKKDVVFGTTVYGKKFCSMIVKDNIVATQFHLEKSGERGLLLLKNIVRYFDRL
ncbi:MAG: imidazole glycerol phosphate synthase subunit HisH [Endomicrobiia bacterium]